MGFSKEPKIRKVEIHLELDLLVQVPCFAVNKEDGKVNGLHKHLVPEPRVEQGFLLSDLCSLRPTVVALGGDGGSGE